MTEDNTALVEAIRSVVREEMAASEDRLRGEITDVRTELGATEDRLRGEITDSENRLRGEITDSENRLRGEITDSENRLRSEIHTAQAANARLFNVVRADIAALQSNRDDQPRI